MMVQTCLLIFLADLLGALLPVSGLSWALLSAATQTEDVRPLSNAHAHNDYYHQRPLLDAVGRGFTSVEADVFLINGELLVGHSVTELKADRTLEELYLKPLQKLARENNGRIYRGGPSVTLLVDIKTNGRAAYAALHDLLARYPDLISQSTDNVFTEKAVTVIVSGDRAFEEIKASNPRYAAIDGRLSDLESDAPSALMPLISDNWTIHFRYRGDGPMSDDERQKLKRIVAAAHAKGRRVRFWATPERPELWQELRAAKVDLIGTDDLDKLSRFLSGGPRE